MMIQVEPGVEYDAETYIWCDVHSPGFDTGHFNRQVNFAGVFEDTGLAALDAFLAGHRHCKGAGLWVAYDSISGDVVADGPEDRIRKYRDLCAGDEDGTVCIAPEADWEHLTAKEMEGNPPRRNPSGIEHLAAIEDKEK